ncbi:trichohyalin-like isoform X2 [Aricia agestis]|uniref:trichohyalin-like isoform X2 n=1 Tax=Aricia agestis TaxID=91739 RepID=UPI001C20AA99|nr:trichohyalin-like isoform X2 [Aricia agestis]
MLSSVDLERLITEKRREIEVEKTLLGLSPADNDTAKDTKNVTFTPEAASPKTAENDASNQQPETTTHETPVNGGIPPDLERYIRRYLGLPVMLRAGEYSPNNPLVRGERTPGDALRGLGEYERRRHTLRRAQQRQYREMLDQQAKKKQEAKEQAERERREREEKERLEEERQRQREEVERERRLELERDRRVELEQDRREFEDRRLELERERRVQRERDRSPEIRRASYTYTGPTNLSYVTKVDTGVQVDAGSAPLSVAVQTDDRLYTPNRQLCNLLTEAERELSPHTAEPRTEPCAWPTWRERRRSCGDFDKPVGAPSREARTVPRYQPSILDGDAVQLRNELAEKEALERRRWYERELRHQIQEQQRLRNQRTARERLLEQAETRRLEEQLRGLRVAHERERQRQRAATQQMKEHASEYDIKRNKLQQEIEAEERLLKLKQPDIPQDTDRPYRERRPYSMNIPEDTLFSHNYDVENYLRRNLNPTKESLISNAFEKDDKLKSLIGEKIAYDYSHEVKEKKNDTRYDKVPKPKPRPRDTRDDDTLPIPVLRHSPKRTVHSEPDTRLSDAMQIVDDKWRVPVVQKNILKSVPNEGGKPVSILTQLGSIRRQLQMEQLKLDKMLSKNKQT